MKNSKNSSSYTYELLFQLYKVQYRIHWAFTFTRVVMAIVYNEPTFQSNELKINKRIFRLTYILHKYFHTSQSCMFYVYQHNELMRS